MGRRELRARRDADPPTAGLAADRLAHLLAEHTPRRAAAVAGGSGPTRPAPNSARDQPAELLPDPTSDANQQPRRLAGPGRAASKEPSSVLRRFGRPHLGVVCALLVGALALAGWSLLRARPVAVATPLAVTTSASGARPTVQATPQPPPRAETILVHVLGAVRRPGLLSLPPRARVADAIRRAGGLTGSANPGELNLAQVLADGQQIVIGTRAKPGGLVRFGSGADSTTGSATSGGSAAGQLIDLNSASLTQLDRLPGVGPVTADRILAWRTDHGRFSRIEELQEVDGIGPKTYARIAPHVRI